MIRWILDRKMALYLPRLSLWRAIGLMVIVMALIMAITLSTISCTLEMGMLWGMDGIRGDIAARGNNLKSTGNSSGVILISVVALLSLLCHHIKRSSNSSNSNNNNYSYRLLLATVETDSTALAPTNREQEDEEWATGGGHPLRAPIRNESNRGEYYPGNHSPSTNLLATTMTMKMKMTKQNTNALDDGGGRKRNGSPLTTTVTRRYSRHRYRQVAKAAAMAATCREHRRQTNTTKIHWNEKVHVKVVQNHNQYTLQEKRNSWYTADEYTRMNQACRCHCRDKNHRDVERKQDQRQPHIRLLIIGMFLRNNPILKDDEVDKDPTCSKEKNNDVQSLWRGYSLP